ncbi:MAG TPA: hypothetical protein VFN56_03650 [Candidatus Saccharimonadales bacterium]|nr:hypothetical protein [Candidatus Saccharimonadales bacterium]
MNNVMIDEHTAAALTIVGRINIGKIGDHQIVSTLDDDDSAKAFERATSNLVRVDVTNSACCIDGRCALCSAEAIANVHRDTPLNETQLAKTPIPLRAHVPGGTFHFATLMALAANIPMIQKAQNFNECKNTISQFLESLDVPFVDAAHTTLAKFWDTQSTGCGAMDTLIAAIRDANTESASYKQEKSVGPISETMATIYGADDATLFMHDETYEEVCLAVQRASETGIFDGYNSVAYRDALRSMHPQHLEVLYGEHVEQGIVIIEIPEITVNRDAMDGELFIYDRWFAKKLAWTMAGTPQEEHRLLMAADYITLAITHQLVAPGHPTAIISVAA